MGRATPPDADVRMNVAFAMARISEVRTSVVRIPDRRVRESLSAGA